MAVARRTSTKSLFFRERTTAIFATTLAQPLVHQLGAEVLRVADVGTGTGKATWGVAAALAVQNSFNFHVVGFDADPSVIPVANSPYHNSLDSLRTYLESPRNPGFPLACLDYLIEVGDDKVQPSLFLRSCVSFAERDLCAQAFSEGEFGAGILTNVAYHYNYNRNNTLVSNVLTGIVDKGLFMLETPRTRIKPGYHEWYQAIPDNFPLEPVSLDGEIQPGIFRKIAS